MERAIQHPNCSLLSIALRILLVNLLVVFSSHVMLAKSYRINATSAYDKNSGILLPGDTIIWEKGLYTSVNWTIDKNGLVVLAEEPGMVTFGGESAVKISADKVIFSGFQFKDGATKGNVVEISGSNVLVREVNISSYDAHYYCHLTTKGSNNTVEHCNFENKPPAPKGKEGSSIFQVAVDSIHPGYHTIRYCSFKNHTAPENAGGDYGMEALRIGYSYQAKFISRTIVEYCLFFRCNGDGEIISNKARENIFRNNTFTDNGESHLTLRHGRDNVVYGNFFLNGAGIRIKEGQNYMVYNNYFQTGNYFAIRLENYKVDPLKNIVIVHNTFTNSGAVKLGGKGVFQPQQVILANNLFDQPTGEITEDPTGKEQFSGNFFQSVKQQERQGFQLIADKLMPTQFGFIQPVTAVKDAKKSHSAFALLDLPELNDDPEILVDIAGNRRIKNNQSAGCFEPGKLSKPLKAYATASNTGPAYLAETFYQADLFLESLGYLTGKPTISEFFQQPR